MPQHDQVIENSTGLAVRTDINNANAALFSNSSGPVEPAVKVPGQLWFDTGAPLVQRLALRDQANAAWMNIQLDYNGVGGTLAAGDTLEATGPNAFARVVGGAVKRSGDTMTGPLNINQADASTIVALNIAPITGHPTIRLNHAAGVLQNNITGSMNGKPRWTIVLGDSAAETGTGNAGSDFQIARYNDAGVFVDSPFKIPRSNGIPQFPNGYLCQGTMYMDGSAANPSPTIVFRQTGGGGLGGILYFDATAKNFTMQNQNGSAYLICVSGGYIQTGGQAYKPGGGVWADLSDARIKDVSGPYDNGLAAILALEPVRYSFKGNDGEAHKNVLGQEFIGLIAQEVIKVLPECVSMREGTIDGADVDDMHILDTGPMLFTLINAVKELSAQLKELEAA